MMATRFMTAGSLKPIVDRTGAESSEFQFVREAYQNAVEAKATQFRIRWEQGASRLGIYRFEAADDGVSMTRHELPAFVNKFGGGGKPIGGAHENFGVGLKSSTLPWNHHGILVIARRDGETNLIHLHLDETAGEYGLRQWEVYEDSDDEEELVDVLTIAVWQDGNWEPTLDRDFEPVKGTRIRDLLDAFLSDDHGTVIILCGNTGEEDTFLAVGAGGAMGQGGHTAIATYISRRYDKLPIPVSVYEPKAGDKQSWPRSPDEFTSSHINRAGNKNYKVKTRNARGAGDFLRSGGERGKKKPQEAGTFELEDKTKIHWFLLPEGEKYDGKGAGGVYWSSTICVQYKGELYYLSGSPRQRFRDVGISRNAVIDRCTIIIEPPVNNGGPGVYPDSSRSRLLWTGGKYLPWSQWAQSVAKKLPTPIEEALEKATTELGRIDDGEDLSDMQKRRLRALTRRIQSSWRRKARPSDKPTRVRVVRVRPAGTGPASKTPGGGRGRGGGSGGGGRDQRDGTEERYVEDSTGRPKPTVVVGRPDQIPECTWLPPSEFDEPNTIGRWNEVGFQIEANASCPIIRESIDYWTNQHPRVDADQVARAVKRVYGLKLRSAVAHMLTAKKRGTITQDQLESALSPIGLTIAAAGFVVEDLALAGDIGALAGKARSKATRARAGADKASKA